MPLTLKPDTAWPDVHTRCQKVAPEAFHDERLLNYRGRRRRRSGDRVPAGSPIDGTAAVEPGQDGFPELDFGPLTKDTRVKELNDAVEAAIATGGVPVHRGSLDDGSFLPGQDRSAYLAPVAILAPPPSSPLFHAEPFGPVDTIVLVDTEAEPLAAMNASNAATVTSLSCDDEATAQRLGAELQAFKVGVNRPRSRGDRQEVFGGRGASWRGDFVGGSLLGHAVTEGPADERRYGNFPTHAHYPEV